MVKKLISKDVYIEEVVNLDGVTENTIGPTIDTEVYDKKTFYITTSGNTDTVTVSIEASFDRVNWVSLQSDVYTTNTTVAFSYDDHYAYMRTKTTSQSNATVTTSFSARS